MYLYNEFIGTARKNQFKKRLKLFTLTCTLLLYHDCLILVLHVYFYVKLQTILLLPIIWVVHVQAN